MIARMPRRLRVAFTKPARPSADDLDPQADPPPPETVAFVAYGIDCILSGNAVLRAGRLTDMLNAHDEYALVGVTVDRLDGGSPFVVDEVVLGRDDILMVHASGPRGDATRRHRTVPRHVGVRMGPYLVRGFFHTLPGTDPVAAIRRRKPMVPLTNARIEYAIHGELVEVKVDTVIVNREQVDWLEELAPERLDFAAGPPRLVAHRK